MPIDARELINSRFGIGFGLWLGKTMPLPVGRRLAHFVADYIARHAEWEMVRAVRANRWVVSGKTLQGAALDAAVRENFRHTASTLFDLYHYLGNPDAMRQKLVSDARSDEIIYRPKFETRGLVVVGLHLGNFDFALQVIARMGLQGLILTLPELLPGGYQRQFNIRRQAGMDVVPATLSNLKRAVEYLRAGGMVITGMDRPEPGSTHRTKFFNYPSSLPVHHISLALKAQVPIVVGCTLLSEDGKYHLYFSDPIEIQPGTEHRKVLISNAEAVQKVAEFYIRQAPEQWAMTYPVWPEALDEMQG